MPYQGGGGIGGPRTRKGRPKTPRPRPAPAPKPDVTLGGDRTPTRSGHAKATRPAPPSQGHPTRGRRTVSGGTRKHPKTKVYRSPTPSVRKQRRQRAADVATTRALRRTRRALDELSKPIKRDTDTHIGPFNLEAELEGRGGLAKAAKFAKKAATSGTGQRALKSAGVVPGLGNTKLEKNFTNDVIDVGAQAIPSSYALGAGSVEAAEGRPKRIKKVAKSYVKTDPVALLAQGKVKQALKQAEQHPGLTALSAYGTGAALSRGAGAAVRAGSHVAPTKGARRVLRKAGNTKRAPKTAPGTGIREPRQWSKGLGGKAVQVAAERVKLARAKSLRKKAKRSRNPHAKQTLRDKANQTDPRVMPEPGLNRRVDEREGMAHARQQKHRAEATKKAGDALPKKHAEVSLLSGQGVAKATRPGLERLRRELDTEYRNIPKEDRARRMANRKLRGQVDAALNDKKLDLDAIRQGAKDYADVVRPLQRELVKRGILSPGAARMAKLIPVAVKEMGAKWNPALERLELNGEKLPVSRIENYLRSTGRDPKDFVYVTQAPGQRGARNFFADWKTPKGIPSTKRTGEATRQGTFEVSREVGRENVARQQGLVDVHNEYSGLIGEQGYRPKGKPIQSFQSRKEAVDWGRENLQDSPYEWTPIPTRPQFGRRAQSEALLDQADAMDAGLTKTVRDGIVDALEGKSGDGKWVLVPATSAKRLAQHTRLLGSTGTKVTRKLGRQFSGTVLTTSGVTWPLGNVAEATVRAAIKRAGPVSWRLGHKAVGELRRLDPEMADELEARIGTGHLGAYELNHVHSTAKDFQGKKFLGPVARVTGAFFRAPGPKQTAGLWNGWTHYIFGGNGVVEHQFRTALLGRYLKDQGYSPERLLPKQGINAISKAAEEAAQGMRETNAQVMAGRYIDRAYGQYSNFSPEMRFTIAVFTPFVAWSLNAVKFLGSVLPKDHPILTGVIASAEMATEEWRKQYGLGKFIDGAAPNWMQASIPVDGKLIPVGRYTPFGFWADPLETSGSLILPALSGIQMASKGLDWKGDPLPGFERGNDVPDEVKAAAMAQSAARSLVPFFGLQEKVRDKGAVAVNPLRGFPYDRKVSAAFDEIGRIDKRKQAIKAKHPNVDADNPTSEYEKLHRRERQLNELIFRESKGKYGHHYKEPYSPGGGATQTQGGGGFFDGIDTQRKSSGSYFDGL